MIAEKKKADVCASDAVEKSPISWILFLANSIAAKSKIYDRATEVIQLVYKDQ